MPETLMDDVIEPVAAAQAAGTDIAEATGPQQRIVQADGRRYSLRLEPEFWSALERAAKDRGVRLGRLVGVGVAELAEARAADPPDLFAATTERAAVEQAIDEVRAKFGAEAIGRGRGFRSKPKLPRAKTLR